MAKFAAVALGVVGALGDDRAKYEEFKAAFGVNGGEEDFQVFQQNLRIIDEAQANDASATYSHITPFANIAPRDFETRNGYRATEHATLAPLLDVSNLDSSYDWRDHGAVNAIKDQGQCGSCWAFSTIANIEGAGMVETGSLLNLSEQQLVDCDTSDGGCNGGLPSNAFQFMIDNGVGSEKESAYPYTAADGTCTQVSSQYKAFITAWHQVSTDETQIAAAVQQYGPLSIGINANTFQFYSGGVSDPALCNPQALDHGVAIVGFGSDSGKDYWTIRNSWGASWGEAGYIRMVRGKGACGLNTDVTTATGISTAMVKDEPRQYGKGFVRMPRNAVVPHATITDEMRAAAPAKLDWTETSGAVSSVKDQGQCGSCWAFSATEGIESGVFMTDGKASPALSPQQITSCDTSDGGCNGGDLPTAFDYVEGAGGIDTDSAYPYTSATGRSGSCKSHNNVVSVTGYKYAVPPCEGGSCSSQDEDGLKAALNSFGPLSVCVNAENFNGYYGGVVASGSCSGAYNKLDHCVQLVGYDTTASTPFWKVKNSWAADWGEAGYIRLPMGENSCGIADEAMYVTATMNGQNTNFLASKVV